MIGKCCPGFPNTDCNNIIVMGTDLCIDCKKEYIKGNCAICKEDLTFNNFNNIVCQGCGVEYVK